MPMSTTFKQRLFPIVPQLVDHYGDRFHIYDEKGILRTVDAFQRHLSFGPYRNFFAVKALPNLRVMKLLLEAGMGFDCSSPPELEMAQMVGAAPEDIMFTSNNTAPEEFELALASGGCILNLDDVSFIDQVPDPFPELICFRFNPGPTRTGTKTIGKPVEAKYGARTDQLEEAYRLAIQRGAVRFGLHNMLVSNELNEDYLIETLRMDLEMVRKLSHALSIRFEFINIGGGVGINYRPWDTAFDLNYFSEAIQPLFEQFEASEGYRPALYTECGRAITGPHGALVGRVLNRMSKWRELVGVSPCMSDLMRPGMYGPDEDDVYHHITFLDPEGNPRVGNVELVDVVGRLCENNDKFCVQRYLPATQRGDFVVIHDTGAHGIAMVFRYNGRLGPAELLLRQDGSVELIRRHETTEDYLRTQLELEPKVFTPA